jgi:prolyl oligopeptidase
VKTLRCLCLVLALLPLFALAAPPEKPPATRKQPVQDTYWGTVVTDDYRWLENASDKEVKAWSNAQNAFARAYLSRLAAIDPLRKRLKEILTARTTSHTHVVKAGGVVFALKHQPPSEQPFLVVLPSVNEPQRARVHLDPTKLDSKGTTAIDWFVPSPDGKLVAVSLSKVGSEAGDVHLYDVATAKQVHEVIPRVQNGTAGGDLAWSPDGRGFFYTRYPRAKERRTEDMDFYQQLFYHELGTATEKDRHELGKDLPRIAEIRMWMHDKTGKLLCTVQNGDGGEFAHYVRNPDGKWQKISGFEDKIVQATFGPAGDLFLVSRQGAPRGKILHLPAEGRSIASAREVVPEGTDAIVTDFYGTPTVLATATRLHLIYQLGGPTEVRVFDFEGKPARAPKQLPVSTVSGLAPMGGDDFLYANVSYLEPLGQYLFKAGTGETVKTPLTSPAPVNFSDVKVVREFATSKDGTKVPVNILVPKSCKPDGNNPCIATAYGGYGISIQPSFRPQLRVLFDHGVLFAQANLRGGSEYGEAWHRAGSLTRKQNVFDDFAAVLKHLIARKYTSSARLGIEGGSNGGLLMGAMITQHPGLMKAVVSHVGIYDMLRVELSPNGAFNVPEFGTVKFRAQFQALYAYSPYHHVKDGTKYPAILFLTGANDPRVDPMQSRKLTARLQAATASSAPILLRTSDTAGHGMGTALSERVEELADVYAFFFEQLGVKR